MKRIVCLVLTMVALGSGVHSYADDAVSSATMSPHQMMQDCMERQKTTGMTMSKAQMKRTCKDELKKQKETGAMPTPPVDTPHN